MAYSQDVTGLSNWLQPSSELIAKAIAWSPSIQSSLVYTDVKYGEYVTVFTSSINIVDGSSCGFTSSGNTTFTEIQALPKMLSVQESFCSKAFFSKHISPMLKAGASADQLEFLNKLMDEKMQSLAFENEKLAWRGNTVTGTANLARTDGWLYQLISTASSADTTSFTSAVTSSNILAVVDNVIYNTPSNVINQPDLQIRMNTTNYKYYVNALRDSGAITYNLKPDANEKGVMSMSYPAYSNITVVANPGLDGSGVDMVLGAKNNFLTFTDLFSDMTNYTLIADPYNRDVKLIIDYVLGFKIAKPSEIVIVK